MKKIFRDFRFFSSEEGGISAPFFALVLLLLTLWRLYLAWAIPLTPDEAYYVLWASHLQPGYLDHPAATALFIRAGATLGGVHAWSVRLFAPFCALLATLFTFLLAQTFCGPHQSGAAREAALVLNGTLTLGIAGVVMTPDTPLLLFTALFLWAAAKACAAPAGWSKSACFWWGLGGCALGLGLDCKFTFLILAAGVGIFVLLFQGQRLFAKPFFLAIPLALICFSPTLIWNAQHDWAGFFRQGARMGAWQFHKAFSALPEFVGGQILLATPVVFLCMAAGYCRSRLRCAFLWVPVAFSGILFLFYATGGRVQANWPCFLLIPLAAGTIFLKKGRMAAFLTGLGITLAVQIQLLFHPFPLNAHWDVGLRQSEGWPDFMASVRRETGSGVPLVTEDYALASILSWNAQTGDRLFSTDPRWKFLEAAGSLQPIGAGWRIREIRPAQASAGPQTKKICRYYKGRKIRCYALTPFTYQAGWPVPLLEGSG